MEVENVGQFQNQNKYLNCKRKFISGGFKDNNNSKFVVLEEDPCIHHVKLNFVPINYDFMFTSSTILIEDDIIDNIKKICPDYENYYFIHVHCEISYANNTENYTFYYYCINMINMMLQ